MTKMPDDRKTDKQVLDSLDFFEREEAAEAYHPVARALARVRANELLTEARKRGLRP